MKRALWTNVSGSVVIYILLIQLIPCAAWAEPVVLDGLIEPFQIVNVGSSVRGVLEAIEVERGDLVKKGQVLARLEAGVERATRELALARSEMKSEIREKQSLLEYTRRKLERSEALFKEKVIPAEKIDEARTNASIALMDLESAKENLRLAELELKRSVAVVNRMTIYSPISGVVMERFLSAGEFIEDQPVLKLAQIDKLNVEIFASVELVDQFKVGMTADVTISDPVIRSFKAKVTIVDRVVDAASGTFGMRLELPNPKYKFRAGLKCRVTFPEKNEQEKIKNGSSPN